MSVPIFQDPRFDALRNAIYHTARGRFLDALNRLFNFLVIVLGATAVGKLVDAFHAGSWVELSIVLIATAQLVFDFAGRSSTHIFLQKRYYDLLAEMEVNPSDDDGERRKWSNKLLTLAGDEPLPMRALDAIAYNTALDALINESDQLKKYRLHIPWLFRRLRHLIAFQGTQFMPESGHVKLRHRILRRGGHGKKET
jgi:hypothetical protein